MATEPKVGYIRENPRCGACQGRNLLKATLRRSAFPKVNCQFLFPLNQQSAMVTIDVQVECGMFGLLRRRKDAIEAQSEPESGQSAEAVVKSDPPEALQETGSDCKIDPEARVACNGNAAEPMVKIDPPKALNVREPDCKIDRETVVALNVKVVCDLAGLLPVKAKYEVLRDEAIGMALSIENGTYRDFALDHVVGLCRRRGEVHVAKKVLDRVTDKSLRERILKICPELRHPGLDTSYTAPAPRRAAADKPVGPAPSRFHFRSGL